MGKTPALLACCTRPRHLFMVALGQLNQAHRAKKEYQEAGHQEWSLRKPFFVNMGGVHIQFSDRREATFPVDCDQLLYLTRERHVEMPTITEDNIDDRNKSDSITRTIAVVQSIWFTANSIGRVAEGIFLSTMELTTLSFVFLITACSICWWRKPMDVSRPIIVQVDAYLSTVLRGENARMPTRGRTPLSFLNRREWTLSLYWAYTTQTLWNMGILPGQQSRPGEADHFPSIDFPEFELKWEFFGGPLVILYSAIFALGTSHFLPQSNVPYGGFPVPTLLSMLLWRLEPCSFTSMDP